jgi:ring-1,2-phenylacetyl-CoA epoxidase subunit PaaE
MSNSTTFHNLTVVALDKTIEDTVVIQFEIPSDLSAGYQYEAGQYLTLEIQQKGEAQRRAYSLCSAPHEKTLAIGVKKVAKGLVSSYLCQDLKVGDTLACMPPQGRFILPLSHEQRKTYYLFAAGSGITPIFSILKEILEVEPTSIVHLLYGNRKEEGIMFRKELDTLKQKYAGQLTVEHILSRQKSGGFSGLFSKGAPTWAGKTGRIEVLVSEKFLADNPLRTREAEYLICGPGQMIDNVTELLVSKNIDKKHIHTERFFNDSGSAGATESNAVPSFSGATKLTVHLNGETVETQIDAKSTILETLRGMKKNPPYSCTSGACSTCMAKIVKGTVKMKACFALDDDEVEAGYILTCQAVATSSELEITFEV